MSKIPEDIMKAAMETAANMGSDSLRNDAQAIALAIQDERERCAKILEDSSNWTFAGTRDQMAVFEDVRELAADMIRGAV